MALADAAEPGQGKACLWLDRRDVSDRRIASASSFPGRIGVAGIPESRYGQNAG
ncbi:MAG TPA: hypothetical protein VKB27_02135 [Gammaproteobacteria bacterium]|nr:hypothetical protein [Gammaproteobacteria bacterium]